MVLLLSSALVHAVLHKLYLSRWCRLPPFTSLSSDVSSRINLEWTAGHERYQSQSRVVCCGPCRSQNRCHVPGSRPSPLCPVVGPAVLLPGAVYPGLQRLMLQLSSPFALPFPSCCFSCSSPNHSLLQLRSMLFSEQAPAQICLAHTPASLFYPSGVVRAVPQEGVCTGA